MICILFPIIIIKNKGITVNSKHASSFHPNFAPQKLTPVFFACF
jgi:hypothetical protein